jgi:hypothetical protein
MSPEEQREAAQTDEREDPSQGSSWPVKKGEEDIVWKHPPVNQVKPVNQE